MFYGGVARLCVHLEPQWRWPFIQVDCILCVGVIGVSILDDFIVLLLLKVDFVIAGQVASGMVNFRVVVKLASVLAVWWAFVTIL